MSDIKVKNDVKNEIDHKFWFKPDTHWHLITKDCFWCLHDAGYLDNKLFQTFGANDDLRDN